MNATANKVEQLSQGVARVDQPNVFSGTSEKQFQIQNSQGSALLIADTKNMQVTATNLIVANTLTLNGHVVTGGDTPQIIALPAAGVDAACTIIGNDTNGTITVTAGSTQLASGPQCTITFAKPFTSAPQPVVSARSKESTEVGVYINTTRSTMTLYFSDDPKARSSYSFNYWNPQ
jgi:hypothetical protein